MSSHHFVKEGQEPALFVLEKSSFQFAEPLLEWVPLVIVADCVLEDVLQWGIKVDIVIQCDLSARAVDELIKDQQPVEVFAAKEGQVISTGLQYLVENDYEAVNIISDSRDEVFQVVELSTGRLQVGIYSEHVRWSLITAGTFEKWMPSNYNFFIRSNADPLRTAGIVQKGTNWQTLGESMVTIQAHTPFWVGEQY